MRDTTPRETPTPTPTASVFESPLPLSDMFVWAPLALVVGQLEGEAEDVPVPEAVLLEAVSMLVTLPMLFDELGTMEFGQYRTLPPTFL
ncbi:hypothetical protein KXX43_004317 [Aspergillus fumigatus]|nr:hypothetical protein KXX43_004317 [Aspergillus fumigatus]